MAGKYISIDHAATRLNMSIDELNRLREKGDLRGFSDRGTWKFRVEDIEEFARSRQADSDAEFDIMFDDIIADGMGTTSAPDSDSDVRLVMDSSDSSSDPKDSSDKKTDPDLKEMMKSSQMEDDSKIKLKESSFNWGTISDSDVRLVSSTQSDAKEIDTDSDIALSDSSMQLRVTDSMAQAFDSARHEMTKVDKDSDSDVQLVSNESQVGSDSDVKLVGSNESSMGPGSSPGNFSMSSDIMFVDEDEDESDVRYLSSPAGEAPDSDSDVQLVSDSAPLVDESGLTLSPFADSTLTLDGPGDSEVSLLADEGSQLYGGSGITLASDSGISLELAADSGISLGGDDDDDGGITLELKSDSGISLADDSKTAKKGIAPSKSKGKGKPTDFNATAPMLNMMGDKSSGEVTSFDFDLDKEEEDSYQLSSDIINPEDNATQVIMFDEEDSTELDAPTLMRAKSGSKQKKAPNAPQDSVFDLGAVDEDEEELFGDDEDMDIADDIVGEDDEVDNLDIFDSSADEEFSEDFESGGSEPEYAVASSRAAPAVEAEWGIGSFLLVLACSFIMLPAALVMFELVNSMWAFHKPITPNNLILDALAGLYKS